MAAAPHELARTCRRPPGWECSRLRCPVEGAFPKLFSCLESLVEGERGGGMHVGGRLIG